MDAVKAGLADGTIDAVATDHAPHAPELKDLPFDQAPPGMLGLQTALPLALSELGLPVGRVLALMSWQPASIAGLDATSGGGTHGGPIEPGAAANLCVVDPGATWTVEPGALASRSHNTPYARPPAVWSGPPHAVPGGAGGGRRRGPAVSARTGPATRPEALLVLADGTRFEGEAIGAFADGGVATGEAVFNTVLSGYQEVITDPSYAGQVIAFTYPHVGNYGVNAEDDEASRPWCRGVIVRDLVDRPSSWRAEGTLDELLVRCSVPGITGVDTRRLTRHLRNQGAMPCAFGPAPEAELAEAAADAPATDGRDLVSTVTTPAPYTRGRGPYRVVAYDFGVKEAMLRQLGQLATVTVVPASTPAEAVLGMDPDGVFLSNGPGDPAALPAIIAEIEALVEAGSVPVFGICLGHQLLAQRPRRLHLQAPLRPPRRKPSGPTARHRPGRDHLAEPQLRGGRGLAARIGDHPCQPQRRGDRGDPEQGRPGVRRPVPPRGRTRPP